MYACAYYNEGLMHLKSNFKLKRFLIAMLAMMMAFMLAFATACSPDDDGDDGDDDDNSPTTTVTDYQIIKNGDFEFSTDEKTSYPYASSINWSRNLDSDASTAPSSAGTSGIIDTTDEVYSKLSSKNKPTNEHGTVINPKTPYYYGLVDDEYDAEDEDARINPQTKGNKILMLNNKHRDVDGLGTAQKFKSSTTISVNESEYAVLSFWINTVNLETLNSANKAGAYVLVTSKLGNETFNNFEIENINTNGQWAKFSMYIEGSELGAVTLSLTFGLGKGNGTDTNNFVEGFAYFDNVVLEKINKTAYNENTSVEYSCDNIPSSVLAPSNYALNGEHRDYASANTQYYTSTEYKINFSSIEDGNVAVSGAINYNITNNSYNYANGNFVKSANLSEFSQSELEKFGTALDGVQTDIGSNPSLIAMHFANYSTASFVSTSAYTIAKSSYDYITFFAKVKSNNSKSEQLKVELIDELSSKSDKDVSVFASISETEVKEGRYGDWVKYKIFVNNPTDKDTTYKIKITYGFDGEWTDVYALQTGYALIANLSITQNAPEKYYELASSSDTVAKSFVYGVYTSFNDIQESETGKDVYVLSVDKTQTFSIQNKPATNISNYTFKADDKSNVVYGLLNSKYVTYDTTNSKYVYGDGTKEISNVEVIKDLNEVNNTYSQVMVLDNKVATNSRYVSSSNTVLMNEFMKVSVKVKATGNAVANVYLVTSKVGDNNDYEVINFNPSDEVNVAMQATVTKDSHSKDGWTEVIFYIAAGNKDVSFRVEIRNGSRETTAGSVGAIFSSGIIYNSIDAEKMLSDKNAYAQDFELLYGNTDKANDYLFVTKDYQRKPLVTKELDDDGKEVSNTTYFQPTEVYAGNSLVKFFDYTTIDADTEIDNTSSSDDTTTDTETEDKYEVNPSAALQVTSIIIALVLIAVMITVIVRSVVKKREKQAQKTQAYYETVSDFDRGARERVHNKVTARKRKIALAEESDEEYDYDESNQIDDAQPSEETAEEITIDDAVNTINETESAETTEENANEPTTGDEGNN